MNKTFAVMLLAAACVSVYVYSSWLGDASITSTSPAGFSASGKVSRTGAEVSSSPAQLPPPAEPGLLEQRYQSLAHNKRLPDLQARLAELHELYPYREFSPAEVVDLMAEPTAWQAAASIPADLPLTDAQRTDGREFIELNPERLEVLLPGDSFELPLERLGLHLQMQVDSREALPGGGFTLHGRILGGSELLRVTITQRGGLSVAGIDTPQGHVVMQANDGQGWIAASDTLFKQDPHRTDMILPHAE